MFAQAPPTALFVRIVFVIFARCIPLLVLGSVQLGDTGAGGVDVDSTLLGLALQVDVESVVVLGVGKDLGTVESHDVVGNRLDRLGGEVHVINAKVAVAQERKREG